MESFAQNIWSKSKLLVKGLIIGLLVLLLMIPTFYVQNLIKEREERQKEAIAEVSSKWASRQNISGPVVVVPYWKAAGDTSKRVQTKHFATFLPDDLNINSVVSPLEKHRGIYKVMLYTSKNDISATFKEINPQKLNISQENILWNEAFVKMYVTDTKGLNEELVVKWNNRPCLMAPQTEAEEVASGGLSAPLNLTKAEDFKNVKVSATVDLSGSEQLLFTPFGKITTVNLQSSWPHPSFTGNILPQSSNLKENGFSATWKSLAHKRNFPQQWKDGAYVVGDQDGRSVDHATTTTPVGNGINTSSAAFGVDLFVPVSGYQKTMRSIKYAVLCILLTFAAFFLIETTQKKSVHPFQYGLIGLALILFYTLLLSFSEYIGFNASYIIASLATIGLIAWFVNGILTSSRLTTLLAMVLLLMYTYIFTLLQLQDYALLLGSIGLFITLGVIMSFTRKMQW
ncbi:cell envelope integrity protein CreD [Chitinophagaceae bacterium LB-8]|uniref:Cell envelope integrity protein CreD n=1 Tax=Paraflavisolibacter caeni TaxID=2982496 RepID=A0A9X2XNE7_9BACT|nr:cell envelope integrity protein CreD [Paraflavisolibacter caeni]MCU7548563.1 cell envelope integrity protein CreD [Paraflavisolibacter caeni]